jgi:hypothetical protein
MHPSSEKMERIHWKKEEDSLLLQVTEIPDLKYKWNIILTYFPNRTLSSLRNRFYFLKREAAAKKSRIVGRAKVEEGAPYRPSGRVAKCPSIDHLPELSDVAYYDPPDWV